MLGKDIENQIIQIVRTAAKTQILPRFQNLAPGDIATKKDRFDLVTEADEQAELALTKALRQLLPDALVVGEEAVSANPALRDKIAEAELAVVLDPVDGTWNFANSLPLFGVILSVMRHGTPVFGLLYDPVMDDWISANSEGPATLTRADGTQSTLSVSQGGHPADMSGFAHFYLLGQEQQRHLAAKFTDLGRVWSLRCSCHEYRTVARGNADFIISGELNPWDHAAGVLICQRAGGVAKMLDGRDYNAAHKTGFLLTAPDNESWEQLRAFFAFLS